ncbi:hypothetical protein QTP86_013187 [Hemibagrus guttatus]|nr:hypothetical protein QTP86_013187 [Hemibagrus guttatus]
MPLGRLPGEVFRAYPTGKRPRGRPRTRWRDYVFRLAWEHLGVPPEELEEVAREREICEKEKPFAKGFYINPLRHLVDHRLDADPVVYLTAVEDLEWSGGVISAGTVEPREEHAEAPEGIFRKQEAKITKLKMKDHEQHPSLMRPETREEREHTAIMSEHGVSLITHMTLRRDQGFDQRSASDLQIDSDDLHTPTRPLRLL